MEQFKNKSAISNIFVSDKNCSIITAELVPTWEYNKYCGFTSASIITSMYIYTKMMRKSLNLSTIYQITGNSASWGFYNFCHLTSMYLSYYIKKTAYPPGLTFPLWFNFFNGIYI